MSRHIQDIQEYAYKEIEMSHASLCAVVFLHTF